MSVRARVGFGLLLLLFGCVHRPSREQLMRDEFPRYPNRIQYAIEHHLLALGMTENQVILAWGDTSCISEQEINGRVLELWAYRNDPAQGHPDGVHCGGADTFVGFDPQQHVVLSSWGPGAKLLSE